MVLLLRRDNSTEVIWQTTESAEALVAILVLFYICIG